MPRPRLRRREISLPIADGRREMEEKQSCTARKRGCIAEKKRGSVPARI